MKIYEIKPASNFSRPELTEKARQQIGRYVNYHRRDDAEACIVKSGGRIDTFNRRVAVPQHVLPELTSRCLTLYYWTNHSLAAGVVFYAYDWSKDQNCRQQSESQKLANLRGFVNNAAAWNSRNMSIEKQQRKMLMQAEEGNVAEMRAVILHPNLENGSDRSINEQRMQSELAAQNIPLAFKDWSAVQPLPMVPGYGGSRGWECPAGKKVC